MADLSDFETDAVEMMSTNGDAPAAVMRFADDGGVEMLLHNGELPPDAPSPQLHLLAAYIAQIGNRNDLTVDEVFDEVDTRLSAWSEDGGVNVGEEPR